VDELLDAAKTLGDAMTGSGAPAACSARVTWATGLQDEASDLEALKRILDQSTVDEILAIRVDQTSPAGDRAGILLAKRRFPVLRSK